MAFQVLKKRAGFTRIAQSRVYARLSSVIVQGDVSEAPHVGYTASRRVGSAVRRNRAKRRLRAAVLDLFRAKLLTPSDFDFVFIATSATPDIEFPILKDHILSGVQKCTRLLEGRLPQIQTIEGDLSA
jgi:ribonuclease P protein component